MLRICHRRRMRPHSTPSFLRRILSLHIYRAQCGLDSICSDVIYLIQLNWQVLMWYKDKRGRLMELKPTLLFPCCASLTHGRLMSLIKENKRFRHPSCKSLCACLCVCVCVCGKLFQLFSLSIISPSLHNGFSPALNGKRVQIAAHSKHQNIYPGHVIKLYKGSKTIDYLINFQLLPVKRTETQLRAVLHYWSIFVLAPWQSPPLRLIGCIRAAKEIKP